MILKLDEFATNRVGHAMKRQSNSNKRFEWKKELLKSECNRILWKKKTGGFHSCESNGQHRKIPQDFPKKTNEISLKPYVVLLRNTNSWS